MAFASEAWECLASQVVHAHVRVPADLEAHTSPPLTLYVRRFHWRDRLAFSGGAKLQVQPLLFWSALLVTTTGRPLKGDTLGDTTGRPLKGDTLGDTTGRHLKGDTLGDTTGRYLKGQRGLKWQL